jgi:ATP-dependent protease ClpP protease subunit
MTINLENVYQLVGNINDDSIKAMTSWFVTRVTKKEQGDKLFLVVNSCGGVISSSYAFIDIVLASKNVVLDTFAVGDVSSMAIPIFLTGQRRIVAPSTTMTIHEVGKSFTKDSRYSLSELCHIVGSLQRSQDLYANFVSSKSDGKLSTNRVMEMMKIATEIGAKEAVELGLAHEIMDQNNFLF